MNDNRKYTGGFRANEEDVRKLGEIQDFLNESRAESLRTCIRDLKETEIHFFHGDELKIKIENLCKQFNLSKSELYKLAIEKFYDKYIKEDF